MASLGSRVYSQLESGLLNSRPDLDFDAPHPKVRDANLRAGRSFLVLADLVAIWLGALISLVIRFPGGLSSHAVRSATTLTTHLGFLLLYSGIIILFCNTQHLYSDDKLHPRNRELAALFKAVAMASILLTGSIYISGVKIISRLVVALTMFSALAAMVSWRFLRRHWMTQAAEKGVNARNVLIVGSDATAAWLRDYLHRNRELGFAVKGLFGLGAVTSLPGVKTLKNIADLVPVCRARFIDEIIVCSHDRESVKLIVREAKSIGVGVRVIPDLYDGMAWGARVDYLGHFPSFALHFKPIPAAALLLKRALDVCCSALGLALLLPLFIAIAIAVKLESPGPVFYRGRRVGRKGRVFDCYKFRTMVANADQLRTTLEHLNEREGILFKISNDPRITRLGRILRKYSLDELPQLWNVIRGDMSIVGPRPPLHSEVERYELEYLRRLEVAPGITGLWQVEARTSPSFDRYIELDLKYVEQWSLMLDLSILFKTVKVVFAGTGA